MKLLLLLCLAVLLGRGLCALPAPLNLTVSSFNFKHKLSWTAAPGSPPGLTYHVFARWKEWKEVATTKDVWAEVKLKRFHDTYKLGMRSSLNTSYSPWSKNITFTPYQNTIITAPKVTMSGCGKCIRMNFSLPKAHRKSGIQDIREIYQSISYIISWRKKGQEAVDYTETKNQTVIIPHLLPGTEYCVQVKPKYLLVIFEPSPWTCEFTSTVQPSQVFAVVGLVAGLVLISLSALVLILFSLLYTGIICKLKEALPHPLLTSLWQHSLLRLERTVPEPVSLLSGTGRQQHSHWDQDEEDQEMNQVEQMKDQEEDQYINNRCVDLSSDSSFRCGQMTSSCQSAASVTDPPGSQNEGTEDQKDEHAQIMKKEEWMKKESKNCKELEEWHNELEKYESVNLFSVTIPALDL